MLVNGKASRTIWPEQGSQGELLVGILDQTRLPHAVETRQILDVAAMAEAIRSMQVRGAPLIGAAAAWGLALAMQADASDQALQQAVSQLAATRPTAVNLHWALRRMQLHLQPLNAAERFAAAKGEATALCEEDVDINHRIGLQGLALIEAVAKQKPGEAVQVMTHCNAGWLGTVDWGTAMAPLFLAQQQGIDVHVWVGETRPRFQGALTAWECRENGVPATVVIDSAAGHLMQRGEVDLFICGCDRVAANGDVANKIGTLSKAITAQTYGVPVYVATPTPTIDWSLSDGAAIPIEQRSQAEVLTAFGQHAGQSLEVPLYAEGTKAVNYGFDVTPAEFVTAYVTEHGVFDDLNALKSNLKPA